LRARGMPQWDDVLSQKETDAIHAFLISQAWEGYNAQQKGAAETAPVGNGHLAN